jgi:recombination protein U
MSNAKPDPKRQLQGAISKAKGKRFEERLDRSFAYYRERGAACVEKTPEPMRTIKNMGNGRFLACFEKKAQPDYKGTIKGGRTVMFEAKYTSSDRMEQSRVTDGQAQYMTEQTALGARCYVVAGFDSGSVYCIPWDIWAHMKEHFGRKYVTEANLAKYRVAAAWNETLQLLG